MFDDLREVVRDKIEPRPVDGTSKVLPLREALRTFVRPGMLLHIGYMPARPMAAIYELMRQYRGQKPDFTLTFGGFSSQLAGSALVRSGIIKKVITGYVGSSFPNPVPCRTYQLAFAEGKIEFEHWTILTNALRLKAAALGLPFLTTKSLIGSNMEHDNLHAFKVIEDPFNPGQRIGILQALHPDVSIIHGLAADANGNTIVPPPLGENSWGAMAAREGAIITVERIVSTEVIRRHNHFVRLPGSFVRSVSEVPFGAHPCGVNSQWVSGIDGYTEDYDFLLEARAAERNPSDTDAWAEKWIYSVEDHQEYLDKVGFDRLLFLKGKAQWDSYEQELEALKNNIDLSGEYNAIEHMVAVSSRVISEVYRRREYKTILAGIGASNLAAWLANAKLKEQGVDVDLLAEIGFFGYMPRPADPFIFNHRNIYTCKGLADIEHVLGIFAAGGSNRCLGSLGAGQLDKYGNINTTLIPPNTILVGSGGANDVASGCQEVVITVTQSRERFLETVPYITSPGRTVSTVVSTLGVYQKLGGDLDLTLTGYLAQPGIGSEEDVVRSIKEQCGWELKVAPKLQRHEGPSLDELRLMRLFDPRGQFLQL